MIFLRQILSATNTAAGIEPRASEYHQQYYRRRRRQLANYFTPDKASYRLPSPRLLLSGGAQAAFMMAYHYIYIFAV